MSTIGHSYKRHSVDETYDAIVIGSGVGGLTAAVVLAKHAGRKVLVLERHFTAGGFTHVFHRRGYEWDVGVHYIGRVARPEQEFRAAFDYLTDGRLGWNVLADVYDRIWIGDRSYDFPTGVERFRERLKGYFPGETAAIDGYLAAVYAILGDRYWYFVEKSLPRVMSSLCGSLLRRGFLRHSDRTTGEVLDGLTRNPELKAVLTGQWGDYGAPPAESSFANHASVAHHYFEGAAYPIGGSSQIAACMAETIERAGGQVLVSADVQEIMLDRSARAVGVRMSDGREIRARTVISGIGAHGTFTRLLPDRHPAGRGLMAQLEQIPPSMSHLCLYVGFKRDPADRPLEATNLWVFPHADHDGSNARYYQDPSAPFPFVFISCPSVKDPTFEQRHPGRATLEVVVPAPYHWFGDWDGKPWKRRGTDYEALKQSFSDRMLAAMQRYIPVPADRIECAELSTPLSTRHFTNYAQGEIYGLSPTPARFRVRDLGARTPFRNLFLTGQDVCTGGVAGALIGGVIAASAVLRRNVSRTVFGRTRFV